MGPRHFFLFWLHLQSDGAQWIIGLLLLLWSGRVGRDLMG